MRVFRVEMFVTRAVSEDVSSDFKERQNEGKCHERRQWSMRKSGRRHDLHRGGMGPYFIDKTNEVRAPKRRQMVGTE
jgi:hypothetical protein